jgi:membrane protein
LFLLWLYVGWMIVLLGAQVAYAHQHIYFYQGERDLLAQSPAGREKLALQLMLLVGRNFYHGLDPMNVSELAHRLRLPAGIVKELMQLLCQTKLMLPLADEESFVLGRDPESIAIKEILDCVRNGGSKPKFQSEPSKEEREVNEMLLKVDQSLAKALDGKNLQTLILGAGTRAAQS